MNRDDVLDITRKIVEKESEVRELCAELDRVLGISAPKPHAVALKRRAPLTKRRAAFVKEVTTQVAKRGPGRPRADDGKGPTFPQRVINFMNAHGGSHTAASLGLGMGLDDSERSALGATLSRLTLRKDIRRLGNGLYAAPLRSAG